MKSTCKILVAFCFLSVVSSKHIHSKRRVINVKEPVAQATHEIGAIEGSEGGHSASHVQYLSGSELTGLAHSSALQANNAVQNQQTAGIQAALGAKTGFAQAALGAAATAQVALVAKQVIVQNLKQELQDAKYQLEKELLQYHQIQGAADLAQQVAAQSQQQMSAATAALTAVQSATQHAQQSATQTASAAAAQQSMIQKAKQKINQVEEQLTAALAGLHQTQNSAQKASAAAQIAQSKVVAIAQIAEVSNQIGQQQQQHELHHH